MNAAATKLLFPILAGLLMAPLACSSEADRPSAPTDAGGSTDAQTLPRDAETGGDAGTTADSGVVDDAGAMNIPTDYDSRPRS